MRRETAVLLHNVRSAHNVGSIFRTCDAAGVVCIYLTGYTPTPLDRFGRTQKEIAKTSLGASGWLTWESVKNPASLIKRLRMDGWYIVGVEQDARSIEYRSLAPREKTLYVFGNEVRGLSPALRDSCDTLLEIPMRGRKESLNVSVAAGVVLFSR